MLTTEDVQRQVAIAAVVAVEKTPFLLTVQRIISRIQVEPDLARGLAVRLQEEIEALLPWNVTLSKLQEG